MMTTAIVVLPNETDRKPLANFKLIGMFDKLHIEVGAAAGEKPIKLNLG